MKKAFTLIELLVVIAIIAILAAILFPVFAQAKAAAKKTAALSSIKQTSLAVLIYSGDSDDVLPYASGTDWWYPNGSWVWGTQPYIKSYPLLLDPSDPKSHALWPSWMDPKTTLSISFASNSMVKWNGTENQVVGVINMLQTYDQGGWYAGPGTVSQTNVNRIAETIMFASHYNGQNLWGGGALLSGVTGWDFSGPQAIPNAKNNGTPYVVTANGSTVTVNANNRNGAVACPYSNNGLFAFTDGHAKAMNPAQTNPDQQNTAAADTKNMWNATRS